MAKKDLLNILKQGNSRGTGIISEGTVKEKYPTDFTLFMDQMLKEYDIKRKDVAIRSGLSQDYTYKLLRGDKKTTERDYILAICIAVGMTLAQTQHALRIYGMPILNKTDIRSSAIMVAIENEYGIDDVNDLLEKAHFPYLRTSPDMPSAEITFSTDPIQEDEAPVKYYWLKGEAEAERSGHAPVDFTFRGNAYLLDEEFNAYRMEIEYSDFGSYLSVFDMKAKVLIEEDDMPVYDEGEEPDYSDVPFELSETSGEEEEIESYEALDETSDSAFFRHFLSLDQQIDKKVTETLAYVDDTRNFGRRYGSKIVKKHKYIYVEFFNTHNAAERQYLQIIERDDGEILYTASHESYFLRIEMEGFYEPYFGDKPEPEYYIQVESLSDLPKKEQDLIFVYKELLADLHEFFRTHSGFVQIEDDRVEEEQIEMLAQRAAGVNMAGYPERSVELLDMLMELLEKREAAGHDETIEITMTAFKQFKTYETLEDLDKQWYWCERTYEMRERVLASPDRNEMGKANALSAITEAALYLAQREEKCGNIEREKELLLDAINLSSRKCTEENCELLFMSCTKYAFAIDREEPERSIEYSEKAIQIVRDYHLDRRSSCREMAVTLYNNHAWVLWNRLGDEEAVIYYGRAIELLEGYMANDEMDAEKAKGLLRHTGQALYNLYLDTNKEKAAARLKKKLEGYGIILEDF